MTASLAPNRAAKTQSPTTQAPTLAPERPQDAALVAGLIDRAFGPGRFVKTAERLREHNHPLFDISYAAWLEGRLVGCVRMWPIHIGETPAVFLGPIAVEPAFRSLGVGRALVARVCEASAEAGHAAILLVGDAPYFQPCGFEVVRKGRIVLPGPVDPGRLMLRALKPGAAEGLAGAVRAG